MNVEHTSIKGVWKWRVFKDKKEITCFDTERGAREYVSKQLKNRINASLNEEGMKFRIGLTLTKKHSKINKLSTQGNREGTLFGCKTVNELNYELRELLNIWT